MRDLSLCTIAALIVVVQCETIHFTNSPSHLIGTTNLTSYKLLVKNSDPITIIEANKEADERPYVSNFPKFHERYHATDRIDVNVDDGGEAGFPDFPVKLLANMGGSHHIDMTNTQNIRGTLGITITGGPSNSAESFSNDYKKSDLDAAGDSSSGGAKKVVYSPILLKKFMQEYAEKLKNAEDSVRSEIQKIHEKIHDQQTTETDVKSEVLEFDKSIENAEQKFNLNGYRDSYDEDKRRKPSNRYKDPDGWVTLEAVPWSSSSVSKWHPHAEEDTRRRPTPRPYNNKPDRFPYHDDIEDDYYNNRPKLGHIDRDSRPGVYTTWTKPQPLNNNNDRPRPKPYKFSDSGSFNSYKYHDSDHYQSSRPWSNNGDIITDNRPSDFPSDSHANRYHDDIDRYQAAASNFHGTYQDRPKEGNGEWVLVSTTKGYQFPNRRQQGNRALFKPDKQSDVIVNAMPQSIRMHKTLKLTVLPALDPALNSTFSTDQKRKPTKTIHGGMIEVDATHETVEDDVRATILAQKKFTTVKQPVKTVTHTDNKNRKLLKGNFNIEERSA